MIFVFDGIRRLSVLILEGIDICVNDEHPQKTSFLILVTEEGIVICVNDEHS